MSRIILRRLLSTGLALAVSVVVLWWLLADGTGAALLDALRGASLWPLALGAMIAIAIQMIRAWRFAILTTGNTDRPSWIMIGIATKLVLLNFLLPFKLGELGFPLMMKRAYGTPFGRGAGILILCRLLDLGVVLAIILLTAAWLIEPVRQGWNPGFVSALGFFALIMPFLIAGRLSWLRDALVRWPRIAHLAGQLGSGASMMRALPVRLSVSALTLSIWLGHAVIAWLTAIAIDTDFGFSSMAMASAASNLAFALPISGVAGLGPPQAAWATMLNLAGNGWTPAITSALLCHGVLLTTLSIFGIALWAFEIFRAKRSDESGAGTPGSSPSTAGR